MGSGMGVVGGGRWMVGGRGMVSVMVLALVMAFLLMVLDWVSAQAVGRMSVGQNAASASSRSCEVPWRPLLY